MSFHRWLQRREYGFRQNVGDRDFIMQRVYQTMEPYLHCDEFEDKPVYESGGIFNLEFSPEGNILVAACEKKTILLFDAITTKKFNKISDAHTDNVNCIKFLDDRMFATCSDDNTVALWDLRCLKTKLRSLHGHSNWVKNIEYSHKDNLLVTSGFDGSIFTWDINSHTEQGLIYQKVFHTSGLMRCRISPDGTKLVICTTGGYLMIIHNLDLTTLHKDLCGFRPSIYRLMQMGHQYIPQAAKFDHVFSKKQTKNRVELVTDFPDQNDAEVVLALQIHPHGHSFLSRNISYDELTEWSCVHDMNEEPEDITERPQDISSLRKRKFLSDNDDEQQRSNARIEHDYESENESTDDVLFSINRRLRSRTQRLRAAPPPPPPPPPIPRSSYIGNVPQQQPTSNRAESFVPDIWAAEVTLQERAIRQSRARNSSSVTGYNFVYAISSGVLPSALAAVRAPNTFGSLNASSRRSTTIARASTVNEPNRSRRVRSGSPAAVAAPASSTDASSSSSGESSPPPFLPLEHIRVRSLIVPLRRNNRQIFQNPKKLTYYVQETNKGKGFIKEPSFSADGRIICSPYDNGVRLLAFNPDCSEYPRQNSDALLNSATGARRQPQPLIEVKNLSKHTDIVLSTKFSPRAPLLVTGCRSGKIVWYNPNL